MYLPAQHTIRDRDAERANALALMRECPFAMLVSTGEDGEPFFTHLPLAAAEKDGAIRIEGHVARANPHWKLLEAGRAGVLVFRGPDAYLSPRMYPDVRRVPTWNYIAVHAHGPIRLVDEPEAKDALLKRLIAGHEPSYAAQWRGLERAFQDTMLGGIVGFEMQVDRLEAKFKLNANRTEAHAATLAEYESGTPRQQEVAAWMRRLGLDGSGP